MADLTEPINPTYESYSTGSISVEIKNPERLYEIFEAQVLDSSHENGGSFIGTLSPESGIIRNTTTEMFAEAVVKYPSTKEDQLVYLFGDVEFRGDGNVLKTESEYIDPSKVALFREVLLSRGIRSFEYSIPVDQLSILATGNSFLELEINGTIVKVNLGWSDKESLMAYLGQERTDEDSVAIKSHLFSGDIDAIDLIEKSIPEFSKEQNSFDFSLIGEANGKEEFEQVLQQYSEIYGLLLESLFQLAGEEPPILKLTVQPMQNLHDSELGGDSAEAILTFDPETRKLTCLNPDSLYALAVDSDVTTFLNAVVRQFGMDLMSFKIPNSKFRQMEIRFAVFDEEWGIPKKSFGFPTELVNSREFLNDRYYPISQLEEITDKLTDIGMDAELLVSKKSGKSLMIISHDQYSLVVVFGYPDQATEIYAKSKYSKVNFESVGGQREGTLHIWFTDSNKLTRSKFLVGENVLPSFTDKESFRRGTEEYTILMSGLLSVLVPWDQYINPLDVTHLFTKKK